MVRRVALICAFSLIPLLGHSPAAYAAPGDPAAGSPSGSVYELPFEKARAEAAPKGSGGTEGPTTSPGTDGEGEEGSGSYYRSENNFGSSSKVPGEPASQGGTGGGGSGAGNSGEGGTSQGNSSEGNSGQAGEAESAGDRSATGTTASAEIADTGNTSTGATIALLVGIGIVAAGIGVFAARRGKRLKAQ